jgi:outer membrane protein assembly factor BamC
VRTKEPPVNHMTRLALVGLALSLSACSVLEGDKINYRSATKGPGLEVPPDLTQLNRDSRYALPGTAVTASSFQATPQSTTSSVSPQKTGDAQLQRVGTQQWLVINRPPEKLWDEVKDRPSRTGFHGNRLG